MLRKEHNTVVRPFSLTLGYTLQVAATGTVPRMWWLVTVTACHCTSATVLSPAFRDHLPAHCARHPCAGWLVLAVVAHPYRRSPDLS